MRFRPLFLILAIVNIFMFIYMAGQTQIGTARTLLTVAFIGLMFINLVNFSRQPRRNLTSEEAQEEYTALLESGLYDRQSIRRRRATSSSEKTEDSTTFESLLVQFLI